MLLWPGTFTNEESQNKGAEKAKDAEVVDAVAA